MKARAVIPWRRFWTATVALCPLGAAVRAYAASPDGPVEPVHVVYAAAAGCPDGDGFFAEVTARTSRVRRALDGEAARTFTVVVSASDGSHHATLEITALDGSTNQRDIEGSSCSEVVSAVALASALAVDPGASLTARDATPTVSASPSASAAPRDGSVAPSDGPAVLSGNSAAALALEPPILAPPVLARLEPRAPYRWTLGGSGAVLAGSVPKWALGGGVFVELARPRAPLVPSFRAALLVVTAKSTLAGPVGADTTWYFARLEVCPLRPELGLVRLASCGFFDAGVLDVQGNGLDHSSAAVRLWLAPGLLERVLWHPWDRVDVEIGGGGFVPLRDYSFGFDPGNGKSRGIGRISTVGATIFLGAGYQIP